MESFIGAVHRLHALPPPDPDVLTVLRAKDVPFGVWMNRVTAKGVQIGARPMDTMFLPFCEPRVKAFWAAVVEFCVEQGVTTCDGSIAEALALAYSIVPEGGR